MNLMDYQTNLSSCKSKDVVLRKVSTQSSYPYRTGLFVKRLLDKNIHFSLGIISSGPGLLLQILNCISGTFIIT